MLWIFQTFALFAVFIVRPSLQISTPSSPTYVAAVVEYSPFTRITNETALEVVSKNVEKYIEIIGDATRKGADIIVFPEVGLVSRGFHTNYSSTVPNPEDFVNPCTNSSSNVEKAIIDLSCEARRQGIYVVVNIPEKVRCTAESTENCPAEGIIYYNTNVAFDRNGTVVARYRKYNLFGEPGISPPPEPVYSILDTDFGVKFGIFTCFDIIFEHPAITLVREYGMTDIIFPNAWYSSLPFLTAVQVQASWSYGMDVNFLASGYDNPSVGTTGSGIYAGKEGVIEAVTETSPTTYLIVRNVTKKIGNYGQTANVELTTNSQVTDLISSEIGENSGLYLYRDNIDVYETILLNDTDFSSSQMLCHNEFCCEFEVSRKIIQLKQNIADQENLSQNGYLYRIGVFEGVTSYKYSSCGIQICSIFACTNSSLSSCGVALDASSPPTFVTKFDRIRISGNFSLDRAMQFPSTLVGNYEVLNKNQYVFTKEEIPEKNEVNITMETTASGLSVYTFGIYGRDYTKDGK